MEKNQITALVYEWQSIVMSCDGIHRSLEDDVYSAMPSKPIKIITGFRRSGKSFLCRQIAKRAVKEKHYALEDVLYLNFEDYQLIDDRTLAGLAEIYDVFLTQISRGKKRLLIFDEIQLVPQWEQFVRTLYEKNQQDEILLTGSNSDMLSSELSSRLAGRFIEYHLTPFSFKDLLEIRGVASGKQWQQQRVLVQQHFEEYLEFGGLPEVISLPSKMAKKQYLQGVLAKVVLDDIIKRFRIEQPDLLEKILKYLLSNVGQTIVYTKLLNHLKPHHPRLKTDTLLRYVQYLMQAFVCFDLEKFDWKQSKIFSSTRKYYSVDTGLSNLFRPLQEHRSYRLENLVYLHLKSLYSEIHYGMNDSGKEIDFIVRTGDASFLNFQVCAKLTPDNMKREVGNFRLLDKYQNQGQHLLLVDAPIDPHLLPQIPESIEVHNIISWLLISSP